MSLTAVIVLLYLGIITMPTVFTVPNQDKRFVTVGGDDFFTLFADGVKMAHEEDYSRMFNVSVPKDTDLLAVTAGLADTMGGLYVDVIGENSLLWRCVRELPSDPSNPMGWTFENFFDFDWPVAPYGNQLWAVEKGGQAGDQVFCRTRLNPYKLEVGITESEKTIVYSDGVQLVKIDQSYGSIQLPGNSVTLAIYVKTKPSPTNPRFKVCDASHTIAHTDLRDFSWRCTTTAPPLRPNNENYWTEADFDDSSWTPALQIGPASDHYIWTSEALSDDRGVYCRLSLVAAPDFCLHPNDFRCEQQKQDTDTLTPDEKDNFPLILGLAVGLGVTFIVAVVILVLALICCCKRRSQTSNQTGLDTTRVSTNNHAYIPGDMPNTRDSNGYEKPYMPSYITPTSGFYEELVT